jgi:hypothetical protein
MLSLPLSNNMMQSTCTTWMKWDYSADNFHAIDSSTKRKISPLQEEKEKQRPCFSSGFCKWSW